QQGIGISAVVMYAQLTTGKPAKITSRIGVDKPAYVVTLMLDTKKNLPEVLSEEVILWKKPDGTDKESGTKIEVFLKGRYVKGKQSVYEYLKNTAIVNPHARIILKEPDGTVTTFERVTDKMPKMTVEIKPHPSGIELGTLLKMAKDTQAHKFVSFLTDDFSRVSIRTAREICEKAYIDEDLRPQDLNREQGERVIEAFQNTKIMAPPTDCLSPIGETLIKKGLKKEVPADFTITVTRPPSVYQGQPFQVEAGLVYGGSIPKDGPIGIMRFANRVPLLYQQGACCITHAIESIDWRRYGIEQRGGTGIPIGPIEVLVHVASTKVPFTSESKEAIADIPEIHSQIELALRECARKLNVHIRRKARLKKMREKEEIIRKILPEIAKRASKLLDKPVPPIEPVIAKIMNSVLIKDDVEYVPSRKLHRIKIEAINYTPTRKGFKLIAVIPAEANLRKVVPEDALFHDGTLTWDVKGIPSLERQEFN
ncbi:MAG: DNA topoisomerase VI subunit B, partial [Thermoplasmata archaeon]